MDKEDDRIGVKSIQVGMRLIISLAESGGPVHLKDLSAATGLPPSKAHRYLVSLLRSGFVIQDPDSHTYDLGPAAMKLGLAAVGRSSIVAYAVQLAAGVREALGETAVLTVWGDKGPTVIHVENSREAIISTIRVGALLPVVHTAAGRIFAAFQSPADVRPIIESELAQAAKAKEPNERVTPEQFNEILDDVRKQRQAIIRDFRTLGVSAVASPLMFPAGNLVAVLGMIGRSERFSAGLAGSVARGLRAATAAFPAGQTIDRRAKDFVNR